MADVRTPELVINKLTKQQYENIQNPSDTEIYLVPEVEEHKPICYPTTASDIKATSMVVKSSVSDNGKILTENGFVYNTSGNPTISDTKVICDLGAGFFEKKLENLTINTEYHIKSYGQNSSGISYGGELVQRTTDNPIPVEYQLVQYLACSGTQYINVGILWHQGYYFLFDNVFFNIDLASTYRSALFGAGAAGSQVAANSLFIHRTGNGNRMLLRCNNDYYYSVTDVQHKLELDIRNNNILLKVNNNIVIDTALTGSPNNNYINIFRFTGFTTQYFIGYCGNIKIIDTYNTKIRDMYPVYRIADNKPGMYDIVNNVFYTNQGTGEFTVGPDKEWVSKL